MDYVINKDLMRIPLGYFNQTVDKSFDDYMNLEERQASLTLEKDKLDCINTGKMLLSRREATSKALKKIELAIKEKLVVLRGFMSVTTAMCEDRVKKIEYLTKIHTEMIGGEEELSKLRSEELGIFEYLAKIEKIGNYLPKEESEKETQGDEPSSM